MSRPPGIRTCLVCRRKRHKQCLLRLVVDEEGWVVPDYTAKAQTRGAYICRDPRCAERLRKLKLKRLSHAFRKQVKGVRPFELKEEDLPEICLNEGDLGGSK